MSILYLAGRELSYARNDVMRRALQQSNLVEVCGDDHPGSLLSRTVRVWQQALPRLLRREAYDLVYVGFYGHLLMLLVGPLARSRRVPILFDAFVSTYDTLCFDRQRFAPNSLGGRAAFHLDRVACQAADQILLDTALHIDYFVETFGLPRAQFYAVPVGCNETLFAPQPTTPIQAGRILYYSTYQPLHGVETVVRAAAQLPARDGWHFRLIGEGQTYAQAHALAERWQLSHVEFVPSVPLTQLPHEIATAEICLGGHFGPGSKAGRTVPGKIYQMLAMARPIIATETPANLALLTHRQTAWLCPPASPEALAEALTQLRADAELRTHLAAHARQLFLERCSEAVITAQVSSIVHGLRRT